MRIELTLMYARVNGKNALYDIDGNIVLLDEVMTQFNPTQEMGIPVRLIADDGQHKTRPCDLQTAKQILARRIKGYFCSADGRKITVYNTTAKGAFPIVGLDQNGYLCAWDKEGNAQSEQETLRLFCQIVTTTEKDNSTNTKETDSVETTEQKESPTKGVVDEI